MSFYLYTYIFFSVQFYRFWHCTFLCDWIWTQSCVRITYYTIRENYFARNFPYLRWVKFLFVTDNVNKSDIVLVLELFHTMTTLEGYNFLQLSPNITYQFRYKHSQKITFRHLKLRNKNKNFFLSITLEIEDSVWKFVEYVLDLHLFFLAAIPLLKFQAFRTLSRYCICRNPNITDSR